MLGGSGGGGIASSGRDNAAERNDAKEKINEHRKSFDEDPAFFTEDPANLEPRILFVGNDRVENIISSGHKIDCKCSADLGDE